jgi:Ca2+-binding EF-hand superfamily protein
MRTLSFAALVTIIVLAAGASRAGSTPAPARENPQTAFAETDHNKDGRVDREEFHERQVDVFYSADTNKDGRLSPAEFAVVDTEEVFTAMDQNKDGSVSMYEFIEYRFQQFDDADTSKDGTLSLEEVEAYLNR